MKKKTYFPNILPLLILLTIFTGCNKNMNTKDKPKFTNRLSKETSPYLLQHAHNPVDWYPWGDEAFKEAKKLDKPIFLSIGYSTCHWCHVMEKESFEDKEIADIINKNYIPIKVDREERPDIDAIYMAAVQAMTGRGGWPMTVWLTPDKKPIYGATYIPARDGDRGTPVGLKTLLIQLKEIYNKNPEKVLKASEEITAIVKGIVANENRSSTLSGIKPLEKAATFYKEQFDTINGGVLGAPKFPSSLPIRFLLRYYNKTEKKEFLNMATITLTKMANGGMYDHVAGGFHRYSTDSKWLVPHFEKMLYDNALLAVSYLEAFQLTNNSDFSRVAKEILDYVIKDMTAPSGGFYSATDADSIGPSGIQEEGYFFTWTPEEIKSILTKDEAELFQTYYNITTNGNFEKNRTILNIQTPLVEVAKKYNITLDKARTSINTSRHKLKEKRNKRPLPLRDEKILTSWNGLMISAFAKASFVFKNIQYQAVAIKAAHFIWDELIKEGRLYRSYKDGQAKHNAYLDDYSFYIAGLIDLYEATSDISWIKKAIILDKILEKHYEDKMNGGFFMTSHDHEKLLAREKPFNDGALPSGNSITLLNLQRLNEFRVDDSYRIRAEKGFKSIAKTLANTPMLLSEMLLAWDFYTGNPKEIIILVPKESKLHDSKIVSTLRQTFIPNNIMSIIHTETMLNKQEQLLPLLKNKVVFENKVTAFVCTKGICKFPTTNPEEFKKQIIE